MRTGTVLADMLHRHGVEHVFGVPGVQTMPLYEGIHDLQGDVVHVAMRDERGAAFAADAYAKVSGRPGVCDATVGPGATNLPSGLGEAYNGSVPVIALVSGIPTTWTNREEFGNASQAFWQLPLFATVSKWRARVERAEVLPRLVRAAFRAATSGRPGPAVLELPQDVLEAEFPCDPSEAWADPRFGRCPAFPVAPEPAAVDRATRLLAAAERPVVVAGGGVLLSGATGELAAVAQAIPAPVATTVTGKGAIPEDHPLALGVMGLTGRGPANRAVAEADLVCFVGCKAGQFATSNWTTPAPGTPVVQLDVDAGEVGRNYPVAEALVGDARLGLAAMASALAAIKPTPDWRGSPAARRAAQARAEWERSAAAKTGSDATPVKPQRLMREIDSAMKPEDVLVSDAAYVAGWAAAYWRARRAGRCFVTDRGLAGIGFGLPAAIGAQLAAPRRRVTCITGDGALGYCVGELETARRMNLPLLVVVFNNHCYGWIKWVQQLYYQQKYISVDLCDVDYARVAEGFGWHGYTVERPDGLAAVLKEARGLGEPTLVDVKIDYAETPVLPYQDAVAGPPTFG